MISQRILRRRWDWAVKDRGPSISRLEALPGCLIPKARSLGFSSQRRSQFFSRPPSHFYALRQVTTPVSPAFSFRLIRCLICSASLDGDLCELKTYHSCLLVPWLSAPSAHSPKPVQTRNRSTAPLWSLAPYRRSIMRIAGGRPRSTSRALSCFPEQRAMRPSKVSEAAFPSTPDFITSTRRLSTAVNI